jgi:tRNA A37 methylthiotransferase MiaB
MFRIPDTIRSTRTDEGGIVLDVHHGQMFRLNGVGSKILGLVENGYEETQIAAEITRAYGVDSKIARDHVHDFIEALLEHHILDVRPSVPESHRT